MEEEGGAQGNLETEPTTKRARVSPPTSTTCRIFYDCETSGQGCSLFKQDRIVELAAVADWASGTALTTRGLTRRPGGGGPGLPDGYFSELVAGGPCTARATFVHGLTDQQLRTARPFESVWKAFIDFVHEAQERVPHCTAVSLVGHNSLFSDNYWLLSELGRCGGTVEELALASRRIVFEDTYPKTEEARRRLKADLKLPSLKNSEVHRALHPELCSGSEAHTALWDAAATRDNWTNPRIRKTTERLSAAQQIGHWKVLQARNALDALSADHSDGEDERC